MHLTNQATKTSIMITPLSILTNGHMFTTRIYYIATYVQLHIVYDQQPKYAPIVHMYICTCEYYYYACTHMYAFSKYSLNLASTSSMNQEGNNM